MQGDLFNGFVEEEETVIEVGPQTKEALLFKLTTDIVKTIRKHTTNPEQGKNIAETMIGRSLRKGSASYEELLALVLTELNK